MSVVAWALDALLAVALPAVALAAVVRRDLLEAVALLFSLGILLALTWTRLGAPDVAMVEAALGAGVTGVLFLSALARVGLRGAAEPRRRPLLAWAGLLLLSAAAAVPVGIAAAALPRAPGGLLERVAREMPGAGVEHRVTAVLLNFRGYDTLLEIAVLVVAVLGAWAARGEVVAEWPRVPVPGPILSAAVRLLVPLMVVVSGALLWVGAVAPGGAFQAGVVLGTVLVLASLSGVLRLPRTRDWVLRAALALGFAVFLLVGAGGAALEGGLLQYPRAHAAGLILAVEAALTLSIGLVMAALFEGRPPVGGAP